MVIKCRKIPVIVTAVQWTGNNIDEVYQFAGNCVTFTGCVGQYDLYIQTLEGVHHASVGDYIIKGVHGEFYPCKPDIFAETYATIGMEE